jgi:hypothetical protein
MLLPGKTIQHRLYPGSGFGGIFLPMITETKREPEMGLTFEKVWAMFQETDRQIKETELQLKETDRKISRLGGGSASWWNTS